MLRERVRPRADRLSALLVACLLLGASACGEEQTEEAKVADAYNAVVEALEEKDYEEACDGLTETTREALRKAAMIEGTDGCGPTLRGVIEDVGVEERALRTVAPADVEVVGETRATVDEVRMSRQDDEWRVEGDIDFVRPFLSGSAEPR